ncbi:MAG: sigma-70 family RNA polymerase sigma factor [Thermomicrobiales bacterium]
MTDSQARAAWFETHRQQLLAVATRLLGSAAEAEDAVQEAWLRLDRAGDDGIENLGGWLTTVVSRICLDQLRTRSTRGEEPIQSGMPEPGDSDPNPEDMAILTESTAEALAVVLDTLTPIERVAFVLHDVFVVPFEEIAAIVDRSPVATRQLASRARRKVRGVPASARADGVAHLGSIVEAFLKASRAGDFQALLAVLDPDVALRGDEAALRMGVRSGWLASELHGAEAVAEQFSGKAQAARLANIDGVPGAVWLTGGKPRVVFRLTVEGDTIVAINLIADPDVIAALNIVTVDA